MTTFLGLPVHAPRGVGALRGEESFPDAARAALKDTQLRRNLAHATATIRAKRAAGPVPHAYFFWISCATAVGTGS